MYRTAPARWRRTRTRTSGSLAVMSLVRSLCNGSYSPRTGLEVGSSQKELRSSTQRAGSRSVTAHSCSPDG